jgi:predicted nucleotidyltransferase component of viral defense system
MQYREIVDIANTKGVPKEVIDKDWVLGHFLNAMFSFPDISENFVFKGGTCLKKIYFQDYRFSEDLDFTLIDKDFVIDSAFVNKIISKVEQKSTAKLRLKHLKLQVHNNIPQGYEITISFWGANHKPNQKVLPVNRWQTKIKLDISFSETLVLSPEKKKILHPYSDFEIIKSIVPAYPLDEVVAEKLRSLMQRNRPRGIYDLYFLRFKIKMRNYDKIHKLLLKKSQNKNINCCNYADFINHSKYINNKRAWESSLNHHLPRGMLVNYDTAYSIVGQFVQNILNQKK